MTENNDNHFLPFENRLKNVEIWTKAESNTNPDFGKSPDKRTIKELLNSGIIIIDKPPGPSSHQTTDYAKRILRIKKAGHSGTLDPGVTGVLPVALARGTRVTFALLSAGKEYVCLMHLHDDVTDEKLNKVIDEFTGKISQLPPKKSAVKRQVRERSVYYMNIIERKEREVLFVVGCQGGTYIRKLIHDMGLKLGCGAHMAELRRTKAGPFKEDDAVTLQTLTDAFHYYEKENDETQLKKILRPIEEGVRHLKKIWIHDGAVSSICHGAYLKVPGISKLDSDIESGDKVAVFTLKNELVLTGVAMLDSGDLRAYDKGLAVQTEQVFMDPNVYKEEKE